jgi:hypothetical protein
MSATEITQDITEAVPEGRRQQKLERRVHDIFVENDRRRLDRRAQERREEQTDRRIASRRDADPKVDEMVAKLHAQHHKKPEAKDHFHHIQLMLTFLSGIIVSQIINFYIEENILTLLLTFFADLI